MKESIRQYMQVGTISFMSYPAIMKGIRRKQNEF